MSRVLQDLFSGTMLENYNEEEDFDYVLGSESDDDGFSSEPSEDSSDEKGTPNVDENSDDIAIDLAKSEEEYYDSEEEEEIRELEQGIDGTKAKSIDLEEEEEEEVVGVIARFSQGIANNPKTSKPYKPLKQNNTSNAMELIQNMKKLLFLPQEDQLYILNYLDEKNVIEFNILLKNSYSLWERSRSDSPQKPTQYLPPSNFPKAPKVEQAKKAPNLPKNYQNNDREQLEKTEDVITSKAINNNKPSEKIAAKDSNKQTSGKCSHIYAKGAKKGQTCNISTKFIVGDRFYCSKHKNPVANVNPVAQFHSTKSTSKKPKKLQGGDLSDIGNMRKKSTKTVQEKKEKIEYKDTIDLTHHSHLCEFREFDANNDCVECLNAKEGDIKCIAIPNKVSTTFGDKSGFLKSFVKLGEPYNTWSIIFIHADTSFARWDQRKDQYDILRKSFDDSQLVSYTYHAKTRIFYELQPSPQSFTATPINNNINNNNNDYNDNHNNNVTDNTESSNVEAVGDKLIENENLIQGNNDDQIKKDSEEAIEVPNTASTIENTDATVPADH